MKHILILGAGKSSRALIDYLLKKAATNDWRITLGDLNLEAAKEKVGDHPNGKAIHFDILNEQMRSEVINEADVVASLLPAKFHILVAEECLKHSKHMVTASYVSDNIRALDSEFKSKGLLFMGEIGLDPGIDHLVMMEKLEEVRAKSDSIEAIYSFCGALIAPESNTNPWHYKFTWAPMNVVLAGQGVSRYLNQDQVKFIPYRRLFSTLWERKVEGVGDFEIYANRNSIPYRETYGVSEVPTILRGTMRYKGYCEAWNAMISLGLTDNTYKIDCSNLSYADFIKSFLPNQNIDDVGAAALQLLGADPGSAVAKQFDYLGIFGDEKIPLQKATPAKVILDLLQRKWKLEPNDKDMTLMIHEFDYTVDGRKEKLSSTLVHKGINADDTSVARLVGLPVGIMVRLIAEEKVSITGVHIPIMKEVYEPVLKELANYGVQFVDKIEVLT